MTQWSGGYIGIGFIGFMMKVKSLFILPFFFSPNESK